MATNAKDVSVVLSKQAAQSVSPLPAWLQRLKHLLGLDRAIVYTVLARVVQILGSTGTVLLILRFLSPVEQGYYYTLLSLVSLQTVFELGFSFVILQLAAHECAHLTLHPDGRIEGDPVAHARLASVLQKTLRWYLVAAAILCVSLLPLGTYFFSRQGPTSTQVEWHGPWIAAVFATSVLFFLNPFASFLEGCGQVWQVGRMRFGQAILGAVMSWSTLATHHGLYAPAMMIFGNASAVFLFLCTRSRLYAQLWNHPRWNRGVSWMREVWPFQWKLGVSWTATYLSVTALTPALFAYRGSIEAGQFGMSLSITSYLSTLTLAWMSTKASPFGRMVVRRDFQELDRVFFRALAQSTVFLSGLSVICEASVLGFKSLAPRLANRMLSPTLFAVLLLTGVASFLVQSMAIYLRAHKYEPFLWQSIVVASLTTALLLAFIPRWGLSGAVVTYLLCTGIVGLTAASTIFRRHRRANLARDLRESNENCLN